MTAKKVVVLHRDTQWLAYLQEVFEDTSTKPRCFESTQEGLSAIRKESPDVAFVSLELMSPQLSAALQGNRSSNDGFRAFGLGRGGEMTAPFRFDWVFSLIPPSLHEFQKRLVEYLPLPDPLHVLVADDEPSVCEMFREYLADRKNPSYLVEMAANGVEAEAKIKTRRTDVLILDIKMPERDGRELYRELKQQGTLPPTIVFFDAVSVEEVLEIRKWGNPAFVEKGSYTGNLPEMLVLIKKLAYFG